MSDRTISLTFVDCCDCGDILYVREVAYMDDTGDAWCRTCFNDLQVDSTSSKNYNSSHLLAKEVR